MTMEDELILQTFGINIKIERLKLKISQEEVANLLNFSASYVSNVESGKHRVSLINAFRFAKFYKKSLDYLLREQ
ncbi:helix-turn-helix transcriptional regulator [bacterium]|nr:helix-turn-helix transcriptional regulator [bacterium]